MSEFLLVQCQFSKSFQVMKYLWIVADVQDVQNGQMGVGSIHDYVQETLIGTML